MKRNARTEGPALEPDLWPCPRCGERFTTRNQRHSCGRFDLGHLFANTEPQVEALYRRFAALVHACGPVTVIPQKTRIAFQVRMRFAAVMPRRSCLKGHLVLAQRHEAPCFFRIESFSARNHVHEFKLESDKQVTKELARWVREAYRVGRQEHLKLVAPGARRSRTARYASPKDPSPSGRLGR
jgi:hypothetical protein